MGTMYGGLSEGVSTGTVRAAQDEPPPVPVRPGTKNTWTTAWQVMNSPVGVVLSVVVAFGGVLGILMSVFLGELRAMEERLRQDMAAMEQGLRQDMAAMEERLRQDMVAMEQELRQDMTAIEERLRQDMAAMEQGLRQDMAAMEERLQAQISELRTARLQGALEDKAAELPLGLVPSQGEAPVAGTGTPGVERGSRPAPSSQVPREGLEPSRPQGQRFLRPSRLPVPPPRLAVEGEI